MSHSIDPYPLFNNGLPFQKFRTPSHQQGVSVSAALSIYTGNEWRRKIDTTQGELYSTEEKVKNASFASFVHGEPLSLLSQLTRNPINQWISSLQTEKKKDGIRQHNTKRHHIHIESLPSPLTTCRERERKRLGNRIGTVQYSTVHLSIYLFQ
ncbi:hypothetical protein VTN96DRAFT_10170 [Rasamsonia emersonii]